MMEIFCPERRGIAGTGNPRPCPDQEGASESSRRVPSPHLPARQVGDAESAVLSDEGDFQRPAERFAMA